MITDIRVASQQLANPEFDSPKDLVSWMGAIQAQNYDMVKWAVAVRLKSPEGQIVEEALRRGDILRTHVMRPTWHLVAAEDIRWMLKLSAKRIKSTYDSYVKGSGREMPGSLCTTSFRLIEKMLEGNKSLTRQEIGQELDSAGVPVDDFRISHLMAQAETEGIICSGPDKDGKPTYALLEERVPPVKELHKEEALARLAVNYFRSHSPASIRDFIWWSGLTATEAKQAVGLIGQELIAGCFEDRDLLIHRSCDQDAIPGETFQFLPSYDEYLISYKDRTTVLEIQHHPKAFNRWGIFYPVIMHNGKVVGNWKKNVKRTGMTIETSFFDRKPDNYEELIKKAGERYNLFVR